MRLVVSARFDKGSRIGSAQASAARENSRSFADRARQNPSGFPALRDESLAGCRPPAKPPTGSHSRLASRDAYRNRSRESSRPSQRLQNRRWATVAPEHRRQARSRTDRPSGSGRDAPHRRRLAACAARRCQLPLATQAQSQAQAQGFLPRLMGVSRCSRWRLHGAQRLGEARFPSVAHALARQTPAAGALGEKMAGAAGWLALASPSAAKPHPSVARPNSAVGCPTGVACQAGVASAAVARPSASKHAARSRLSAAVGSPAAVRRLRRATRRPPWRAKAQGVSAPPYPAKHCPPARLGWHGSTPANFHAVRFVDPYACPFRSCHTAVQAAF